MKAIGGYFELELAKGSQVYHQTHALKSGRSALHFILKCVNAKKIYIPFYTCNALLEPIEKINIPFEFYGLNDALEPLNLPELGNGDYFLYINYFDLKRDVVEHLSQKYKSQFIADCSQAFFFKPNGNSWYFNSCRKFFGVPDGAYLYAPEHFPIQLHEEKNENFTMEHLIKRKLGNVSGGYPFFLENESLCGSEIKAMSILSEDLMSHVDYELCIEKRNENFNVLDNALSVKNNFKYKETGKGVPMAYPFLPGKKILHQQLWDKGLFSPILWKDVLKRNSAGYHFEKNITENLLALPIDHRYNVDDMHQVIEHLQII